MANFILDAIYGFNYKKTFIWENYRDHNDMYRDSVETNFWYNNDLLSFVGTGLSTTKSGVFNGGTVEGVYVSSPYRKLYISEVDVSAKLISSLIRKNTADSKAEIFKNIFSGDDDITLGSGADVIDAFGGDDTVRGRGGNDVIAAGAGNDVLFGGTGMDKLTGGAGADIFVFDAKASKKNIDTITDFSAKSDVISLDHLFFRGSHGGLGTLIEEEFRIGVKAQDEFDRVIYNNKTGALYYDADGNGRAVAVQFAILNKGLALTSDNFDIM
ncbi:hypothetical protein MUO32_12990 [Shinella sp. CPCC 101442]|uniref:calcium-binding protein n=1 Tax=Shinella sp. CPCC 101442 TaxID=2932265 RepID=UPI0027E431D2|nr:M10 family metallopeptidase C-terminal domain-containing protein [Shinella sp. CPCC 101442]MCR6499957.1 hypothetical protein [Shinella sp. CPCC 101442]